MQIYDACVIHTLTIWQRNCLGPIVEAIKIFSTYDSILVSFYFCIRFTCFQLSAVFLAFAITPHLYIYSRFHVLTFCCCSSGLFLSVRYYFRLDVNMKVNFHRFNGNNRSDDLVLLTFTDHLVYHSNM